MLDYHFGLNMSTFGGDILIFAQKLVELQRKNHETNYRLAKELGVHPTTIQNWRDGKRPRIEHLLRVAEHYGLSIEEFLS